MALVDELLAVGSFLHEASKFPASYSATKSRQLPQLLDFCKSQSWSPGQATEALKVLGTQQQCWSEEEKTQLVEAIHLGMAADGSPEKGTSNVAVKYQDYTNLLYYLPEDVWAFLMDEKESDAHKIMKLTDVAKRLGLRLASELTWASWTALVYHMPGCKFGSHTPPEMHAAYVLTKQYGKSILASAQPWEGSLVERLSPRWQDFDPKFMDWRPAPLPSSLNPTAVIAMTSQIPCRTSKRGFKDCWSAPLVSASKTTRPVPSLGSSPSIFSMDLLRSLVQEIRGMPAQEPTALPGLQIFSSHQGLHSALPLPPCAPVTATAEPLPAPPAPVVPPADTPCPAPVVTSSNVNVQDPQPDVIDQAKLLDQEMSLAQGKQKNAEKPASEPAKEKIVAPKSRPSKKKPAAKRKAATKQASKKKAKTVKKTDGKAKDGKAKAERDKKHYKNLLTLGVPKKMLDKFKGGCAKCRRRQWCTRSCWFYRAVLH